MFRVSKPTGTYLRAVLEMCGPGQNDAWHRTRLGLAATMKLGRARNTVNRSCYLS